MIVAHAPMRVSLAGGGSDLPAFYRDDPGAVVSATIDKYVWTFAARSYDRLFRVRALTSESVARASDLADARVREAIRVVGVGGPVQLASLVDVPPGSGLGSSSAYTASVLHALHSLEGREVSPARIAAEAIEVEVQRVGAAIGRQDQYAAAYGGLNFIRFGAGDSVEVEPVRALPGTVAALADRLLAFAVGAPHDSNALLAAQARRFGNPEVRARMRRLVELAVELRDELELGRVDCVGEIVDEGWHLKRSIAADVSSTTIDDAYETAVRAGASGCKLLGAGGGGFLLVVAEPERHASICAALRSPRLPFQLAEEGSTASLVSGSMECLRW